MPFGKKLSNVLNARHTHLLIPHDISFVQNIFCTFGDVLIYINSHVPIRKKVISLTSKSPWYKRFNEY